MTLNLTFLTRRTIYQSADYRLTDLDTRKVISYTSAKLITLHYDQWDGLASYTGIGRWPRRDTSEHLIEWLTGLGAATPSDVASRIQERGTVWLRDIESARSRARHTFILATFEAGRPGLDVISNCEDCFGNMEPEARASLFVSTIRTGRRPTLVVTGWKPAVDLNARRL